MRSFFQLFLIAVLLLAGSCETRNGMDAPQHRLRLSGYWHNWRSQAGDISLRDIPRAYTDVLIAFALPEEPGSGVMAFTPHGRTPAEFRADIRYLQNRGTRVLLSLGGGNHPIELHGARQGEDFVRTVTALVRYYGFDGIDLNLEGASIVLDAGDTDFRNPRTPKIRNMILAVREIRRRMGPDFLITAAPETRPVTGGFHEYGGNSGGWLPLLHNLRDELDLVHFQLYNSGTQFALVRGDRPDQARILTQGTPEFVWGMAEMLILGFPVNRDPSMFFPGLGAEKVSLGFPATPRAGSGGYQTPEQLRGTIGRLLTGQTGRYPLRSSGGHPRLGGIMTWSIHWDATRDYAFARAMQP